jgi:D-alanyl-D-alanine carboxypeptidase/D-alanyl-D-alanine-endopeptidase (penicillin-binding protein 4)
MTARSTRLLAIALLLLTNRLAVGGDKLETRVEAVLNTPGYGNAHWGLLVVDSRTGRVVFERNPDRMFAPASVTKLFSTAAALVDLGADHRFRTPVVRRGNVDSEGKLLGDLILIASGDLNLGGRAAPDGTLLFEDNDHTYSGGNNLATLVPADPLAGLDELARGIVAAGIKAVDGDVLIDARLFQEAESTGSGPRRVSPIVVNDNLVDVLVSPSAKVGEPASVKLVPNSSYVSADVLVETVAEGEKPSVTVRHESQSSVFSRWTSRRRGLGRYSSSRCGGKASGSRPRHWVITTRLSCHRGPRCSASRSWRPIPRRRSASRSG